MRTARTPEEWDLARRLLFAYQQETARDMGRPLPRCMADLSEAVRLATADPAAAFSAYLLAYGSDGEAAGGVALVAHDPASILLRHCFVLAHRRRGGVAGALVEAAEREAAARGARRLVLDVLASRRGAIAAWRRLGFVACAPWHDGSRLCFERPVGQGGRRPGPDRRTVVDGQGRSARPSTAPSAVSWPVPEIRS